MAQCLISDFDASFAALSDATRRGILEQLGRSDASLTELAAKFRMTLTGMKNHDRVLEQAGLVATQKIGRVRTCRLGQRRLEEEAAWIERYRRLWEARFDALDAVLEDLKQNEKIADNHTKNEPTAMKNSTTVDRTSDRELLVTRTFNGPAHLVFAAWTRPELLKRWWAAQSF